MLARDYRAIARERLANKWLLAVLVSLVASILGGTGMVSIDFGLTEEDIYVLAERSEYMDSEFLAAMLGVATVVSIISLIQSVIRGPVQVGLIRFNKNLYNKTDAQMSDLFILFKGNQFLMAFVTNILISLFTVLWTLLLVIPGIVKSFAYSQAFYIMEENPDIQPMDAIRRSEELMKGNKWRLFCLQISFFGWYILSIFTFGIGIFFLTPYVEQAKYAFYRSLVSGEGAVDVTPQNSADQYILEAAKSVAEEQN